MVSRKDFLSVIRGMIQSGEWPPGHRLPSTARLADTYKVSESLVNQAMATLIDTGEIVTIPGGARYVPPLPGAESLDAGSKGP